MTGHDPFAVMAGVGLAWASAVCIVDGVAIYRATRRTRAATPPLPSTTRVLMLRPCAGVEPHLERTLRSSGSARASVPFRVRLSVAHRDDPARPVTEEAARWLRAQGIDACAAIAPVIGPNQKIGQLAAAVHDEDLDFDVILVVDSDVDLTGVDLDPLVAAVADPTRRVAASWCPPVEPGAARTLGDRVSAAVLGASLQSFVLLGGLDVGGLVGKTFAVRADALREIGGFEGLAHHLGEDMEMARRLRARGWSTQMVPQTVPSLASGRSLQAVLDRYSRWLMVIRSQRPTLLPAYPLLLTATPLIILLCLCSASSAPAITAATAFVAVMGRVAVARAAAARAGLRRPWHATLVDAALADGLLLVAFARALGPARVRWRHRTLRLGTGGLLIG